jgi:hypothetical protein
MKCAPNAHMEPYMRREASRAEERGACGFRTRRMPAAHVRGWHAHALAGLRPVIATAGLGKPGDKPRSRSLDTRTPASQVSATQPRKFTRHGAADRRDQ